MMTQIIKINSEIKTLEQLLFSDRLEENNFVEKAIENEIIKQESRSRNIENSNDEIIQYLENFKNRNRIDSPEKFELWLNNMHQSKDELFGIINFYLLKQKLMNSITENDLRNYYEENKAYFDEIKLHSISVSNKYFAEKIEMKLRAGIISFRLSEIKKMCEDKSIKIEEFIGSISRKKVNSSLEEFIKDLDWVSNNVFGPLKFHDLFCFYKILDINYSDFVSDKEKIRDHYFRDYIFNLKSTADIKIEYI